jgi:hypothetical protein
MHCTLRPHILHTYVHLAAPNHQDFVKGEMSQNMVSMEVLKK